MTMMHRAIRAEITPVDGDESAIEISASSEYPVQRGRWVEILSHDKNAVRINADTVLLNHDADQIIGGIDSCVVAPDKTTRAKIRFATTDRGKEASALVRAGMLRGVSIGYSIESYDQSESNGITTIRATAWTIREISMTPIPADPTVGIGRSTDPDGREFAEILNLSPEQPAKERAVTITAETKPEAASTKTPDAIAIREEAKVIATQAESLGLRVSDFAGMDLAVARDAMLAAVVERKKANPVPGVQAEVLADRDDKLVRHCAQSMLDGGGIWAVREFADAKGIRLSGNGEIADWMLANLRGNLIDMKQIREWKKVGKASLDNIRAVNTSDTFTMVAGLAATKLAFDGFTSYKPWSDAVVSKGQAADFKTIRTAGLQFGNFSSPSEGSAFSDLTVGDAGGSGSLTMRGAGLALTKQAIYNDELNIFWDRIKKVGYLAAQHQDKLVASAIPGATWTAATAALALSSANLKTAWTNFMAVTGPASEKPGYLPKILLVPSALYLTGVEITTLAQGATTESPLAVNTQARDKMPLHVVHGAHLSDANDWFILADPNEASGFTYFTHPDYPLPQLFEIDPGLVASRNFRIEYPSAVVVSHLNPGTNTKPVGAYQATQA